jgi:hypothetical protein
VNSACGVIFSRNLTPIGVYSSSLTIAKEDVSALTCWPVSVNRGDYKQKKITLLSAVG